MRRAEEDARRLRSDIARFRYDPLKHAKFVYPRGKGALTGMPGPRAWQREVMGTIAAHLADPATRHTPLPHRSRLRATALASRR